VICVKASVCANRSGRMNGVGEVKVASTSSTGNGAFSAMRNAWSPIASIAAAAARSDWPYASSRFPQRFSEATTSAARTSWAS
jgi:hypothetical protein